MSSTEDPRASPSRAMVNMATQDGSSPTDNNDSRCHLCHLSNEILCTIARHVTDASDLAALARTCKLLCHNITSILYKSVVIEDAEKFQQLTTSRVIYGPDLLELIHSLDLYTTWGVNNDDDDDEEKLRKLLGLAQWQSATIKYIGDMKNLRHLSIEYEGLYLYRDIHMPLPQTIPVHLVSCSLKLFGSGSWDIQPVVRIFEHLTLKRLDLFAAQTDHSSYTDFFDMDEGNGIEVEIYSSPFQNLTSGVTSLETLILTDCYFLIADIQQILCYPRALRFLSICIHTTDLILVAYGYIYDEHMFRAISQTNAAQTLEGFCYDMDHKDSNIMAPLGLDKLANVRYLEISHRHMSARFDATGVLDLSSHSWSQEFLPPKLEVLKIRRFSERDEDGTLLKLLQNKNTIIPLLRRIILVLHHRGAAVRKEWRSILETLPNEDRQRREEAIESMDLYSLTPQEKKDHEEFKAACQAEGIELMLLYENGGIFRDPIGPVLWDIPEQIA